MALGFSGRSENTRYLRYNGMGQLGGTFSDAEHDDIPFVALADLEYIRTGWLLFERGLPPDLRWDEELGKAAPRPGKGHKRGLCLRLYFPDGGIGLRELTTNNQGLCGALDKIYAEFEFAPQRAAGLVPLVEVVNTVPSETPFGTVHDVEFAIIGWHSRPRELAPPPPAPEKPAPRPTATALAPLKDDLNDNIPF
jgi:hypothetical protein